ncbi:MAG: polyprenyl synthetase family protein [Candidatus Kariarchaeaceae archaeon]
MQAAQKTDGFEIFDEDRALIQGWIVDVIQAEYQNSLMREMILPFFANPSAKKLRPLIILNVFRTIYGEEVDAVTLDKVKHLCSALEISHNASLMIDDVFDKDIVRRGEDAFHVKFGTFASLAAGYNLSAFVFDLATRTDNHQIVREIGKVGTALSSALFMSKDLVSYKRISRDYFMDLLFRKTSALFVSCSKTAALLSSDDPEVVKRAEDFGNFFGTAYQLRDDVLAIIGNKTDLGKPPHSDIENRFQSLITIEAMELATEEQMDILKSFYLKHEDQDLELIQDILVDTGAVRKVAEVTLQYVRQAREILESFEDSASRRKLEVLLSKINFDKYHPVLFES